MKAIRSIVGFTCASLLAIGASFAEDATPRARDVKKAPHRSGAPKLIPRIAEPPGAASAVDLLREEIEGIWAGRALRRGVTAVYVVEADTGKPLYQVHSEDKLNPASNVKLLSTATVLDQLGPNWRYVTRLFGRAADSGGIARGDIYLRGSADPTFWHQRLPDLAAGLSRAGVRKLEGDIVLSDDLLRDTLSGPQLVIEVTATQPGKPPTVTVTPDTGYVQVEVSAKTSRNRRAHPSVTTEVIEVSSPDSRGDAPAEPAPVALDPTTPRLKVIVAGKVRVGRSLTFKRPVGLRSTYTGHLMREALVRAGIEVTGAVRLEPFEEFVTTATEAGWLPVELSSIRSAPLSKLVARTNKRSINWLADHLLMTAGWERHGQRSADLEHGLATLDNWLSRAGISPEDVVVDTGSGLSRKTQLSARQIVQVLRSAAGYTDGLADTHLDSDAFLQSLSVGGVDGTLRGRFKDSSVKGWVIGKTGTLRDSIALSGFISDESGEPLCFAIVTNTERPLPRQVVRREQGRIVHAMSRYLGRRQHSQAEALVADQPTAPSPSAPAVEPIAEPVPVPLPPPASARTPVGTLRPDAQGPQR